MMWGMVGRWVTLITMVTMVTMGTTTDMGTATTRRAKNCDRLHSTRK